MCYGSSLRLSTGAHSTPGTGRFSLKAANIVAGKYKYMEDLASFEQCIGEVCPVQWPLCPSPIAISNWTVPLLAHPDQRFAAYIHSGLSQGFRIGVDRRGPVLRTAPKNHPSALAKKSKVEEYILGEVEAGRMVGPIGKHLGALVHSSPIGLVPKSHQVDKFRMIVDLSSPRGHSTNDSISKELSSIMYASVDDAVEQIIHLGRGTQLVKVDLQNAYRNIPVHPQDQHLLAVTWEGRTYVDRALPFGLRSAPKIFSAVADMITWALHCAGVKCQIHYLDDFLFICGPDTEEGNQTLEIALKVLQHLGVPVAAHKTEGPAVLVVFLGILIDTVAFELRLPLDKIQRLQALLTAWLSKKAHTRKELESLLGHLSHAATVIRPGRTFLRQLFDVLHITKRPNHYVRLNAGAKADLAWWKCFLQHWNGTSFFPLPTPGVHVHTDASGTFGCGAVVNDGSWIQAPWPPSWQAIDISVKELVPVVAAAALWGSRWSRQHVRFHCDNIAVVAVLNKRTAKSPPLAHLLRCLSFYSAYYGFHLSAEHIPGVLNTAADALSRDNLPLFHSLVPYGCPWALPPALEELLIRTRPDWGSSDWTTLFTNSLAGAQ